ncbi:MAG: metallophosphoesterase [Saprospiraceae bacterium]
MKIIQLTDLHIGAADEKPHDIDVRQNFLTTLQAAVERRPDYLVVTGDLCLDVGDRAVYEWVKGELDKINIPYEVQAGNHDDVAILADVFGLNAQLNNGDLFYKKRLGEQFFYFLDTSKYTLSQSQMQWFEQELSTVVEDVYLFIHHPPIYGGVPFMDIKHPLVNRDEVADLLLRSNRRIHVFCGHYHVDKVIQKGNLTVYITPSLYFQINDGYEEFQLDHRRVGFREIILEDEMLRTAVRYV